MEWRDRYSLCWDGIPANVVEANVVRPNLIGASTEGAIIPGGGGDTGDTGGCWLLEDGAGSWLWEDGSPIALENNFF